MRKSEYIGWKEVFHFTLVQGVRGGAYKGFLIVGCLILLLAQPVVNFFKTMDKEEEAYHCEVTELTVYDEVGLPIDYTQALADEGFKDVKINTAPTMSFDDHMKLLEEKSKDKEGEKSKEVIVHMTYEEAGYFNLTFVKATSVNYRECQKLVDTFKSYFDEERMKAVEVTQEQLEYLNQSVDTKIEFLEQTSEVMLEEGNESISIEVYMVSMLCVLGISMLISLSGSSIAISIATEKSTKVVEYLMINVRPMALITGKIMGTLVMVLVQFLVMGGSYGLSTLIARALFRADVGYSGSIEAVDSTVKISNVMKVLSDISILEFVMIGTVIFVGILFFSVFFGLAGASVSKLDEINEGLTLCNVLMCVGATIGMLMCSYFLHDGGNQMLVDVCCLLPISAPYVLPTSILLGKISTSMAIISILILLITTSALFKFTAKVYEAMIFYNGKVLKLKDILQMAKRSRVKKIKGAKAS